MAEVKNYAVIDQNSLLVVNVAAWDGVADWHPGQGFLVIQNDTVQIGATYNPVDGSFSGP